MKIYYFQIPGITVGEMEVFTRRRDAERAAEKASLSGEPAIQVKRLEYNINRDSILSAFIAGADSMARQSGGSVSLDGEVQ